MNEHNFTLLSVPLPPMLPKMVGVVGNSRYFSIAYWGSKATWFDGRGLGTFSYLGVYSPLIEHPVLAIHLESYNLGSDDLPPTHAILCDCLEQKMYVGDYAEVEKVLETQHPPVPNLSPEEFSQLSEQIALDMADFDLEQFQRLGMFELFAGHSEQQKLELVELVQWLDRLVTEDLLQQYVEAAKKGNWTAISVTIPEHEIEMSAVRSQGAGGQNVNKLTTAIHLRFDIMAYSLPERYKERLLKLNDQRLTKEG